VRLFFGSFHAVDSDQLSFELAAKMGYRNSLAKVKKALLEPIMKVEVVTPDEYMGDIIGDLNKRRGMIEGVEAKEGTQIIRAMVPLANMFGYVTALRTISSGRATSTMVFDHYDQVPDSIAEEIINK
jgi:elongation factor G